MWSRHLLQLRKNAGLNYSITSSARASSDGGTVRPSTLGRLGIDDQLELRRLHDREVCRLGTLEDATGIHPDLTIRVRDVRSVAHQPADFDILTRSI